MLGSSLIGKCAIHFLAFDVKFLKMLLAEINLIFIFFLERVRWVMGCLLQNSESWLISEMLTNYRLKIFYLGNLF